MRKEKKRFAAIALITALAITMLTGLQAGCRDLRLSADAFFDAQKLHDIYIQSTLGLTEEDIEALNALEDVEAAAGFYSESVHLQVDGSSRTAEVRTISETGVDAPYLLEGRLPEKPGEIAVTVKYMTDSGCRIGDSLTFTETLDEEEDSEAESEDDAEDTGTDDETGTENTGTDDETGTEDTGSDSETGTEDAGSDSETGTEDAGSDSETGTEDAGQDSETDSEDDDLDVDIDTDVDTEIEEEKDTPSFPEPSCRITGVVIDVCDINAVDGSTAFRSTSVDDYIFFVDPSAVDSDVYTAVAIVLKGTAELPCYEEAYKKRTEEMEGILVAAIQSEREQARTAQVKAEAEEKIADAEQEMREIFEDIEEQFRDAREELDDGKQELEDARQTLEEETADARREIEDGREQIEDGYKEIEEGEDQLDREEEKLVSGRRTLEEKEKELTSAEEKLAAGRKELEANEAILEENDKALTAGEAELAAAEEAMAANEEALAASDEELTAGEEALAAADQELKEQEALIAGQEQQVSEAETSLESAFGELEAAEKGLEEKKAQLEKDRSALENKQSGLSSKKEELTEKKSALEGKKSELEDKKAALDRDGGSMTAEEAAALKGEISSLEGEVSSLEGSISDLENDISGLEGEIASLEERIPAAETEIGQQEPVLAQTRSELESRQEEVVDARQALDQAAGPVKAAREELDARIAETTAARQELEAGKEALAAGRKELDSRKEAAALAREEIDGARKKLEEARKELDAGDAQTEEGRKQIEKGWKDLIEGAGKIDGAREQMRQARIELADAEAELEAGEQELEDKVAEAEEEIADGEQELADGERKYRENWDTYTEKKAEAEDKIADARQEVADMDPAQWFITNRSNLSGYHNVEVDAATIESLAIVFAMIFLAVAVLICLTTVNRMVEEDRGLIGTYQALGFTDNEIRRKYMAFTLAACAAGSLLGDLGGYIAFPEIIFVIFRTMYQFPSYQLGPVNLPGILGPALFLLVITGAVWLTCRAALREVPAQLMRPRAPQAGSRVFLEYITPLWTGLSFLNKVTARNIFRYKKRLFMTVIGITGCTSLLVCGFAIKDSVGALMPRQYEYIVHYDWMAVTEADDHDGLCGILDQMPEIRSYLELDVESVTVRGPDGSTEIIQLYVVPDSSSLEDYVLLKDISSGAPLQPGPDGIIVTRNASVILSFEAGDTISLQDLHFRQHDFKVSAITENYLGNAVYMTRDLYERTFGKFEANAVLAIYREGTDPDETARILEQNDIIRTSVSTSDLKSQFEAAFTLINVVVYLLIVMAAALAFVVLFTLASTNISERERELATIKVLGFYDREVHLYVNKETLILTGFGILLGMPTGALYAHALTPILRMPSLYFAVSIRPFSFVLSAALALLFALLVNRMTDRTLNGIDPAEALKSIE